MYYIMQKVGSGSQGQRQNINVLIPFVSFNPRPPSLPLKNVCNVIVDTHNFNGMSQDKKQIRFK